jgi:hypothetical protein
LRSSEVIERLLVDISEGSKKRKETIEVKVRNIVEES